MDATSDTGIPNLRVERRKEMEDKAKQNNPHSPLFSLNYFSFFFFSFLKCSNSWLMVFILSHHSWHREPVHSETLFSIKVLCSSKIPDKALLFISQIIASTRNSSDLYYYNNDKKKNDHHNTNHNFLNRKRRTLCLEVRCSY